MNALGINTMQNIPTLIMIFMSILLASVTVQGQHTPKNTSPGKESTVEKANMKRAIINNIRGGDYTNAGGAESIDYIIKNLKNIDSLKGENILDLGSGYGGSANYLYSKGLHKIWGVDINQNAVDYSNQKYPHIKFFHLDAMDITKQFKRNFFSCIYMFNVIYAIEDKAKLISNLTKVARKGAKLVIFDYSKTNTLDEQSMKDFGGTTMYPVEASNMHYLLKHSGWKVTISQDISDKYIEWYEKFLDKFSANRAEMLKTYDQKNVEDVENLFNKILFNLRHKTLGGALIIAEKL